MAEIDGKLKEKLNEIIEENNIKNPQITISDAVKGGYMGLPSRILIEGTKNGIKSQLFLFMKAAPKSQKTRENAPVRQTFCNEIAIYENILPSFSKFQESHLVREPFKSFPKCCKCSLEENNEFLIFEDLVQNGFVMWNKSKPMGAKQVEFILKECAKLHAVSFAIREKNPNLFDEFVGQLNNDLVELFKLLPSFQSMFYDNARSALCCFDKETEKETYLKFENFIENELTAIFDETAAYNESVIVHGDNWCNNYMFKFEDVTNFTIDKMMFLDWQCSRLASPVLDLSYFLYGNGSPDIFDNLDYYLKLYHDCLRNNASDMGCDINKHFSFSVLKDHWKKFAKFGLSMSMPLMTVYYDPKHESVVNIDEVVENGMDFSKHFTNFDICKNEKYRNRVRGLIKHFVNNDLF